MASGVGTAVRTGVDLASGTAAEVALTVASSGRSGPEEKNGLITKILRILVKKPLPKNPGVDFESGLVGVSIAAVPLPSSNGAEKICDKNGKKIKN